MSEEHGVALLETDMQEICNIVDEMEKNKKILKNGERNTIRLIKLGLTKKQVKSIKRRFATNFKTYGLVENYNTGANLTFLFFEDFCSYLEKENISFKTNGSTCT